MSRIFERMSKGRWIALALSVLLVVWGISTLGKGSKGLDRVEAYTGQLNIEEGAYDERFDIYVDSPVLIRTVEMYQYVLDKDKGRVELEFVDHYEYFDNTQLDSWETYSNPQFPNEPKSEVFCGKVSIGDTGLYLSEELLKKLSMESYIYFENQTEKLPVGGLSEREPVLGLVPMDEYTYGTPGGEYWQVGDLKVTWYAVDPASLAEIYTAAGQVENSVIGGDIVYLYDSEKSLEEIDAAYSKGNTTAGTWILIIGIIAVIISLNPLWMPYVKPLLEKLNIKLPAIGGNK